ncbi:MAG: serine/threonine protein kinase [Acidobacteriaceae bacterium]|nr:serine/threonine protein kinase [Acidobacteriaceae bacterium]
MTVTSGTKFGPYEIQSALGAGGMGEVYRAMDTRLDRTVAIKVLASHLSSSPELKQRMEREARTISSLNHPHICHLYDIGSHNGTDFLVMEFLEGETLADRLRKGPMPLNELLKIGIAIAEALSVAHHQGIVHRDLKPGNIMLTHGGAKLMDFGLAKPLALQSTGVASGTAPSFTAAATLSGPSPLSPLTSAGSIVGTIQYMSPEQIEGKEAGARSDIFAFGAVLYEMVTGKRPFAGKSQISLASAILEKDPDPISASNLLIPPALEHVIITCLQKDPEDRYLAAHDIKLELKWIASGRSAPALAPASESTSPTRQRYAWIAAVIAAILLGVAAGFFINRPAQPALSVRTVVDPPEKVTLNLVGDFAGPPVLSPDGSTLAFTAIGVDAKTAIWVRPMNALEAHMLPGSEGATFPFWSPDGRSLGFFADGKLKTIELSGGSAVVICDAQFGRGGSWGPNGVIIFAPSTQTSLMRVSATGGEPVALTQLDKAQQTSHRWPFFLPDGKHFLYLAINHDPSHAAYDAVYYASLDGRENRQLFRSGSNVLYGSVFLLFARVDQLMAQPFDPASGTLSGEPQALAAGVVDDVSTWHMDATASNNGLLVFGSGGTADWKLVWMDRNGKQLGLVADKLTNLQSGRISPQGDRVALQIDTGTNDVWVLDLARGIRTRLTFGQVTSSFPVWSPDGKWLAYNTSRNGQAQISRKPADGSGAEELLLNDQQPIVPTDWSQDGKYLIYMRGTLGNDLEVWALPLEGERKPFLVVPRPTNAFAHQGRLSPDGRWLAYASTESGTSQIYVVPFHGGQGKWQVSTTEGSQPKWSRDGKELYFANDITRVLSAVSVKETSGALQFGPAITLATAQATQQFIYDVSPDGKKILLDVVSQQVNQSVTVITNFTAGLKK